MQLGPYETLEVLGSGGAGTVLKARGPSGHQVAVKILREVSAERRAAFAREVRLLKLLGEEDGFVPILDDGEVVEGPFLVMPLLDGGTLRRRIDAGPLGVEEVVTLGRSLAASLAAAHAKGVVHRDLKPENILHGSDGRPLIADLGLAKHFDTNAEGAIGTVRLTGTGQFKGTAGYMAPEQMKDAARVGPEADVFALAAILQECLTGRPAFPGQTPLQVVTSVMEGRVEPLERADVPRWLRTVIARALASDPGERYEDGAALLRALEAEEDAAPPASRLPLVAAGVLVVALAVAGGLAWRSPSGPPSPPPPSPSPPAPSPPSPPPPVAPVVKEKRDRKTAEEWFERAASDRKRGDLAAALGGYTRAIDFDPEYARAFNNRGLVKGLLGDDDGALADFTRSLELDPKLPNPWRNRGELRARRGDDEGALSDLTRGVTLDPSDSIAWTNLASVKARRGDGAGAIDDYTRAIREDPKNATAYNKRGLLRRQRGDEDGALEDYEKAIAADPLYGSPVCNRAVIKNRRGDAEGALADYDKAIALDPRLAAAWMNRGLLRGKRGEKEAALADLEKALALGLPPNDAKTARDRVERLKKDLGR